MSNITLIFNLTKIQLKVTSKYEIIASQANFQIPEFFLLFYMLHNYFLDHSINHEQVLHCLKNIFNVNYRKILRPNQTHIQFDENTKMAISREHINYFDNKTSKKFGNLLSNNIWENIKRTFNYYLQCGSKIKYEIIKDDNKQTT